MKSSYNSPTPFLPSTKFYLNVLGSSYLKYLLKSLVRSINFNFFFYLIDESLYPPSLKLISRSAERRLSRKVKSLNESRVFSRPINSTPAVNIRLKHNMFSTSNVLIRKRNLVSKPTHSAANPHSTFHPSSKWLMSNLLTTTSYALLGVARSKHKIVKSPSKMLNLSKLNRLQKRLRRPLKINHKSKAMLSFKHRKLLLFKNFISLSRPGSVSTWQSPVYKNIRFKRKSRFFRSRISPYFFLDWSRAPKISSSYRITSIWSRFKSLSRFRLRTSQVRVLSNRSSVKHFSTKAFKGSIRKWLISKAKRGQKVWSRRIRRLVLRLRLNKRFWYFRHYTSKIKFSLKSWSHHSSPPLTRVPVKRNNTQLTTYRSYSNLSTKSWLNKFSTALTRFPTREHNTSELKSKNNRRLKKFLKPLTSQWILTQLSGGFSSARRYGNIAKIRVSTRKLLTIYNFTRRAHFTLDRRLKVRSKLLTRKFTSHSTFLRSFRVFKKKGQRVPRRFRRLGIRKSKKLLSSKWSNFKFRLFRIAVAKRKRTHISSNSQSLNFGINIGAYRSLATLLTLQTFLTPFHKIPSSYHSASRYAPLSGIVLTPNSSSTLRLLNSDKRPVMRFHPNNSFFFVTSPFFFLNYIAALPVGLSDSLRSPKLITKTRSFTVFPDSDSIKALFFRYVNRQKSLAQSRKSFYRAFSKRRPYRSTKLLKSNVRLFNINNKGYSDKFTKTSVRTTNWVRLKKLHLLPRRIKNSVISRIRRIRFKPGYGRIWRSARVSVKDLLGIRTKYQYRLTPILQKQYLYSRNEKIERLSFTLGYALLSAKFAHDTWVLTSLLTNNNVYLNGTVCTNDKTRIFTNDFVQLLVNLKYYISLRWLKNWTFRKRNKVSKIFYKKIRPGITRGAAKTPKLSRNLPNYFFSLKYCYSDVPRCFEVDYFSLSLFVIHDQLRFERYLPRQQFRINYFTLNMYNWKYIT